MKLKFSLKALIVLMFGLLLGGIAIGTTVFIVMSSNLPKLITVADYDPKLVSEVFDRNGKKIGEFARERRELTPFDQIPEIVKQAFIAAEDNSFYEHSGVNYVAILRAALTNLTAGYRKQGASTITQQVAKTLMLTSEKTYTRKIKEVILAHRMEANLSKEDILYLYLNQIYFGQGAYGVAVATDIYFRKELKDITVEEAAMLAGLPKAPSAYSPVYNPKRAKERQVYVLNRMASEGYITEEQANEAINKPLKVFFRRNYKETAPYFLEQVRQLLVKHVGEENVLDNGIKIYTSLDVEKQNLAQDEVKKGLRELDKRQGFRGPLNHIEDAEQVAEFLGKVKNELIDNHSQERIISPDGKFKENWPLNLTGVYTKEENPEKEGEKKPNLPDYVELNDIVKGIVTKVDDKWGLVYVRFAESKGLIDIETMGWAREPDANVNVRYLEPIAKPSKALKKGDVIWVRLADKEFQSERLSKELKELKTDFKKNRRNKGKKFENPEGLPEFSEYVTLELEQEPIAQGALMSVDQKTNDILAYVGGYDFDASKFDRVVLAARQTGSSFKPIVYAAGLDKGYTAATSIIDAPLVYEEEVEAKNNEEADVEIKKWKPNNHSKSFKGDILYRNALIYSLNVPTVKIIEKIGTNWVADYARRLGIFNPLNMDFTLALGTSGVSLYEVTKVFSQFGRLGQRTRPVIIHKVEDQEGKVILEQVTLDERFQEQIESFDKVFEKRRKRYVRHMKNKEQENKEDGEEPKAGTNVANASTSESEEDDGIRLTTPVDREPPLFFEDPEQLMKPETAYVTTSILRGVIEDPGGTGGKAREVGRPLAGKTGSTSDYFDAWFVGYSPDIATGVWVGFDNERSLGKGEVGGRSALPIWIEYMKGAHENLPVRDFEVPENIVFANIDNDTGKLASANSKNITRQAFIDGTEPNESSKEFQREEEDQNFFKEDLSE